MAIKFEDVRKLYYEMRYPSVKFVKWNCTNLFDWEYELLRQINAIDDKAILANYPILKITAAKDGKEYSEDYDGDMSTLIEKKQAINADPKKRFRAEIVYTPRFYILYKQVREEMYEELDRKKAAEKYNREALDTLRPEYPKMDYINK